MPMSKASSHVTTDHDEIREWAEERGGRPATVEGTEGREEAGILRIDFQAHRNAKLKPISWEDFFDKFEESDLAFLYQEETADGDRSNFCKLISRATSQHKKAS